MALRQAATQVGCARGTARRYFDLWRDEICGLTAATAAEPFDHLCLKASDILKMPARYAGWGNLFSHQNLHWVPEDIGVVVVLARHDAPLERAALILGRRPTAVAAKADSLGLSLTKSWRLALYKTRPSALPRDNVKLEYPYLVAETADDNALIIAVNAIVPRGLPGDLRSDVCQDMLVAILAGELSPDQIKAEMPKFLKAARKRYSMPWGTVNIDAPIWDGARPLSEMISENPLYDN